MDIKHLIAFREVCQEQNLSRAAQNLNYTQPTITYQIQSLEKALHTQLFKRVNNKLIITDAGYAILPHVEKIINEFTTILTKLHESKNLLTIGASTQIINYLLPFLTQTYHENDGKYKIHFLYTDYRGLERGVLEGEFTLGLTNSRIYNKDMQQFRVLTENMIFVGEKEFVQRHGAHQDISRYPFVNFSRSIFRDTIRDIIDKYETNSVMYCNDTQAVKEAALNGLGIALLPQTMVENEIASGRLIRCGEKSHKIHTYLTLRKQPYCSEEARKFILTLVMNKCANVEKSLFRFLDRLPESEK